MGRFESGLAGLAPLGSLVLRLTMAEIVGIAGYKKIFVAGFGGVINAFTKYGIPVPQVLGPLIAILELGGGILLALGFLTRILGVLYACEFVVAAYTKWVTLGEGYMGSRLDTLMIAGALLLATHGAGRYSLDASRGRM